MREQSIGLQALAIPVRNPSRRAFWQERNHEETPWSKRWNFTVREDDH
jgi:hypothetical protein